jgi:hypothetical protein
MKSKENRIYLKQAKKNWDVMSIHHLKKELEKYYTCDYNLGGA